MNLREFLAWWLRGLRATVVALDESVTQRRLNARDDAELARDIAELRALQSAHEPVLVPVPPVTVSLETLWARPVVEPDRSGYARVLAEADAVLDVAMWLYGGAERGFMADGPAVVRDAAVYWLAMRERVTGVRL